MGHDAMESLYERELEILANIPAYPHTVSVRDLIADYRASKEDVVSVPTAIKDLHQLGVRREGDRVWLDPLRAPAAMELAREYLELVV